MLPTRRPQTWHARAVDTYRQSTNDELSVLREELAAWIAALTQRTVLLEMIYVDVADRTATVALDGVVFQLRRHTLVLLRSCPECGLGAYESPAIQTLADLGYALSDWQPHCRNCTAEDPADYLDYQTL
jgi:hypothetical protein